MGAEVQKSNITVPKGQLDVHAWGEANRPTLGPRETPSPTPELLWPSGTQLS